MVGKSSITPFKQEDFKNLFNVQIWKTYGAWLKHHNDIWCKKTPFFIDCTAGDMSPDDITSPQLFLEGVIKTSFAKIKMPSELFLIEKNPEKKKDTAFDQLQENYEKNYKHKIDQSCSQVCLIHDDFKNYLSTFPTEYGRFGLLYFDLNGFIIDDYLFLYDFLKKNTMIDMIFNVNCCQLKRNHSVTKIAGKFKKYNNYFLQNIIDDIPKKYIWIRDDIKIRKAKSHWQYVMLFGTNMKDYNIGKDNAHFYLTTSTEGESIINKYNLTQKEKENGIYTIN